MSKASDLLAEHDVIQGQEYSILGSSVRCQTCGPGRVFMGSERIDAIRRHDLEVLQGAGLLADENEITYSASGQFEVSLGLTQTQDSRDPITADLRVEQDGNMLVAFDLSEHDFMRLLRGGVVRTKAAL